MNGSNLIGTQLGKYEILEEVGRGGMGAVYKGYDPALDRHVAVKVLAPHLVWEKEFVERFVREARAAARLKHPGIVTIHDVGQEAGWYYFVMEYLEGETLNAIVKQRGQIAPDDVVRILRPLAEALDYAHHRGLVHRDIKPGNIIVNPEGSVTLTDFGIARAAQETRLTATGTIVGTPEYMSPEQVRGRTADARSDQYSLAVVAYEMLSGQVPFEAESTLALLHKVAYEPPPPICQAQPDLPKGIEAVLNKALAKEPGDRYTKVSDFVDALERALAGEAVERVPTLVMQVERAPRPIAAPPPQPEPVPTPAPPREREPKPRAETIALMEPEAHPTPPPRSEAPPGPQPVPAPLPRPRIHLAPPPFLTSGIEKARNWLIALPRWAWAVAGLAVLILIGAGVIVGGRGRAGGFLAANVLFVSDRDGKREIYVLSDAGVGRVTRVPGSGESWSPFLMLDGSVLFTSNRDGKEEIYHLTKDGEVERVTRTPGSGESWSPASAPDGSILFTSDRDGKREVYHLTKAGEVERITRTPGDGESWSPAAMRDGSILFTSDRDGRREVYHLAKDGEVERVTRTPGSGESWSPVSMLNGSILFTSDRDGKREVYNLSKTGEVERITRTPGGGESWSPASAPDGGVLFVSDRYGKQEVYHLTKDGEVEQITSTAGSAESWSPAW